MSSVSQEFADYILEQLAGVPGLRSKRLFGGLGLSADGVPFAIVLDNTLYFVVDDETRPGYEALGCRCFNYQTRRGQVEIRRYFEVPAEAFEAPDRLRALAEASVAAAVRNPSSARRRR